jgi:N utilization substance protein A
VTPELDRPSWRPAGINTRDDLADLAVDELVEMTSVDDEALALIMKAREHWFTELIEPHADRR